MPLDHGVLVSCLNIKVSSQKSKLISNKCQRYYHARLIKANMIQATINSKPIYLTVNLSIAVTFDKALNIYLTQVVLILPAHRVRRLPAS